MSKEKQKKPFYKKVSFYIIAGVIVLICIFLFKPTGGNNNPYSLGKEYPNEKVDVNGMTISEACSALREKGWTISSVDGINNNHTTESSDCSDTSHIATDVSYYKQYSEDETTPECAIKFNSNVEYKEEDNSEPKGGSDSNSSNSTPSSENTSWKEVLNDYEAWVDQYVAFMKKYKNASSSDAAAMMSDYSDMLAKQTEWTEKIDKLDDDLKGDDLKYYLEVTARCNTKMAEALK